MNPSAVSYEAAADDAHDVDEVLTPLMKTMRMTFPSVTKMNPSATQAGADDNDENESVGHTGASGQQLDPEHRSGWRTVTYRKLQEWSTTKSQE
jgi:hypothetical protein